MSIVNEHISVSESNINIATEDLLLLQTQAGCDDPYSFLRCTDDRVVKYVAKLHSIIDNLQDKLFEAQDKLCG